MRPYEITSSERQVVALSDIRIPFEPVGLAKDFRGCLRDKISRLTPNDDDVLIASFASPSTDFYDVENVLLYNIGPSQFNRLSRNGIVLRSNETFGEQEVFRNRYQYDLMKRESVVEAMSARAINDALEFAFTIDKLNTSLSAADYWMAFHQGEVMANPCHAGGSKFGLYVELSLKGKYDRVASIVKSLIDGIISALHTDTAHDPVAVNRLASKLGLDTETVTRLLGRSEFAILGTRELLSQYRTGVKWNPADERCTEIVILQATSSDVEAPIIRGMVYWLK